ncbi:MAG: 2-oxoacid:acceptor oxidoreductase subunit alpha [Myxococcales bacterium]|nr:2-oxoacid:acceptor oxidoreductase subunit alpha [Myxococcales bacterium]
MSETSHASEPQTAANGARQINDFCINVATANGTGSQTSNIALLRAMFRMGIPVAGKNLFPSNIQGLPTWYNIRLSKAGHIAHRDVAEILVAMNPKTVAEDLTKVPSGGVIFYDTALPVKEDREDVVYYAMPVKDMVKSMSVAPSLREYIANMVYVGVVAEILGIEMEMLRSALDTHFSGKKKAVDLNMQMIEMAAEHTRNNLPKRDPYWIERIEGGNKDLLLVEGNAAGALGSVYGGVNVVAWYPITPATSLADGLNEYLPQLRRTSEGKSTYAVIQAEDELAAIGMCVGAGWAGARSMTSTSGPGISLMAEFAGLAYQAEIPTVVWDIQRVGPSTGLPTRTSQGDLGFTYQLGHGDSRHIILLPANPAECFEFGYKALDLAEQFQTPVFVLSDLDLGMNLWMSKPFVYPETPMNRGKVLTAEQLEALNGNWGRYADVDGDGIPYRTLPGTNHPAAGYFTRGTGHNDKAAYSERPEDWEGNLQRLRRKFNTARKHVPKPELTQQDGGSFGLISFGTNHNAIIEAMEMLKADGHVCDYLRIRALPATAEVGEFIEKYDRVYVIENNFDGQMHGILLQDNPSHATRLASLSRQNGMPLSAIWLHEQIKAAHERFTKALA